MRRSHDLPYRSEFHRNLQIQLSWRKVIWNTVLAIVHIFNPGIGDGIVHLKKVKHLGTDPDVVDVFSPEGGFAVGICALGNISYYLFGEANIHPTE